MDLLLKRIGILVRFVAVIHPTRGVGASCCVRPFFVSNGEYSYTSLRFKIEVSFKQAIQLTIGSYAYHFWMKTMRLPFAGHQAISTCTGSLSNTARQ